MSRSSLKSVARLIDIANEKVDVSTQFLQDLEYSIEKTENNNDYIPSKTYKPSSLKCIRSAYFQIIGEIPDKSNTTASLTGICESRN